VVRAYGLGTASTVPFASAEVSSSTVRAPRSGSPRSISSGIPDRRRRAPRGSVGIGSEDEAGQRIEHEPEARRSPYRSSTPARWPMGMPTAAPPVTLSHARSSLRRGSRSGLSAREAQVEKSATRAAARIEHLGVGDAVPAVAGAFGQKDLVGALARQRTSRRHAGGYACNSSSLRRSSEPSARASS